MMRLLMRGQLLLITLILNDYVVDVVLAQLLLNRVEERVVRVVRLGRRREVIGLGRHYIIIDVVAAIIRRCRC